MVFNIQTDHLIPARLPDLIIINNKKENLQNCRLCCPGGLESWRTGRDYPNDSIAENGQNPETSPRDSTRHSDSSERASAKADVKNSNE